MCACFKGLLIHKITHIWICRYLQMIQITWTHKNLSNVSRSNILWTMVTSFFTPSHSYYPVMVMVPWCSAVSVRLKRWSVWSFSPYFLISIVTNYKFDKSKGCISNMTVEIDFLQKKYIDSNPYDSDKMANDFLQRFYNQAFSVGQQVLVFLTAIWV